MSEAELPSESAAPIAEMRCPSCDAKLRNVVAGAGGKAACLNCGARFALSGETENAPQLQETARAVSEPRAAGYWLLRICAGLAACGAVGVAVLGVHEFFVARYPRPAMERFAECCYLALLAWGGVAVFFLANALARIEAGALRAAWRAKLLVERLPAPTGSSLPYIAPLAVVGGVLPAVKIVGNHENTTADIVALSVYCAALILFSFTLEDLRQFFWRQRALALRCGLEPAERFSGERFLTFLLPAVPVLIAALVLGVLLHSRPDEAVPVLHSLFLVLGVAVGAVPTYLLARDGCNAVGWWALAAGRRVAGWRELTAAERPVWLQAMRIVPLFWMGWVWVVFFWLCANRGAPPSSDFIPVGAGLALCMVLGLALPLSLIQIHRWRRAHAGFWASLRPLAAEASLTAAEKWLVAAGPILTGLGALSALINILPQLKRGLEPLFAIPLFGIVMLYPPCWLAAWLREMLLVQAAVESAVKAGDEGEM